MKSQLKTIEVPININEAIESLVSGDSVAYIHLYEDYLELIYNFDYNTNKKSHDEDMGIDVSENVITAVRDNVILKKDRFELSSFESIYYITDDSEIDIYNTLNNKSINEDTPLREYCVSFKTNSTNEYNIKCKNRKQKNDIYNEIKEWILS